MKQESHRWEVIQGVRRARINPRKQPPNAATGMPAKIDDIDRARRTTVDYKDGDNEIIVDRWIAPDA
eukprot:201927-Pyramimonas_sp.AAC.1